MRKIGIQIIILVYVLFSRSLTEVYGQSYIETITKGYEYAYIENDYQKALEIYEKAFKIQKPQSADLFYAADISLKTDSVVKFKQYLSQAVDYGYANFKLLNERENFKVHFDKEVWDLLILRAEKNYKVFEKDYESIVKSLHGLYKPEKIISGKTDLRNDSLTVKHQGHRNTCSVFAATALMEYSIFGEYDTIIDLSEAYNYWVAKTYALSDNYLREMYEHVDGLAGYIAVEAYKYGSMFESEWKYENTNWLANKDERCKKINGNYIKECFTGIPPENSKTAEYKANPVYINREDIGQYILQEKKPVIMNIFWYYDAMDNETGNFRLPIENDVDRGGHVILLVGYDSEKRTFIFQNSWGTNWGQGGFGTIPEDYILNYFEAMEIFPYGNDAIAGEKTEAVKASLGVSVLLNFN